MPRPKKATVDYFPHFVASGKTMFSLESRWGNDGYAFWFKLLEMLGASEQHYIDCENTVDWEYLLAKTRLSGETANDILTMLAKLDAIDQELWQYRIIRSTHFIDNLAALYKRREITVINNTAVRDLCLQKREENKLNIGHNLRDESSDNKVDDQATTLKLETIEVSANNNPVQGVIMYTETPFNGISVNKNPQSKVKESKYNNNKLLLTPSENLPASQETPSAAAKPLVKESDLYNKTKETFEAVFGQFSNYAREGSAIKKIIKLAKGDEQIVRLMLEAYLKLTKSRDKFWSSQPFTPSALLSLWDRVRVEAEKTVNDMAEWEAVIGGGT